MDTIRLTYRPEDEHHGLLQAVAEVDGFRGHGAAWFNRRTLGEFLQKVSAYPLPKGDGFRLMGGEGVESDGSPASVHLGLTLSPVDLLGTLKANIELAHPISRERASLPPLRASLSLLTTYGELQAFLKSFPLMLLGEGEAVLRSIP